MPTYILVIILVLLQSVTPEFHNDYFLVDLEKKCSRFLNLDPPQANAAFVKARKMFRHKKKVLLLFLL